MTLPDKEILAGLVEGSPYPVYLILGDDLRIAVANSATLKAWGKDNSVIGMRFGDALPELANQPFEALLRKVMTTGEPYYAVNDRAELMIGGKLTVSYYTFSYQPISESAGQIVGVACYATDVTELVNNVAKIQELNTKELASNTALILANESLEAANEELISSYNQLETSEKRFRNLIQQAPFAICVIRANDLIVSDVNERYLELVGKTRMEVDWKMIWDAIPEAAAHYAPVMQTVIDTNVPYVAKEAEVTLVRNGIPEQVFIDFVYEPVVDLSGSVMAVMVIGIDVSEKVNTRKSIEEIEERMRLATQAADIGIYELKYSTNELTTSDRFNEILGLENPTRESILSLYHPDDVHLSEQAHGEAKLTGNIFYEARLFPPNGNMKWVRFQARIFYNTNNEGDRVIGTAVDITEYKALQQQKDDFISIASHELKTPVTTLKASLQMLERMKSNFNPAMFPKLVDQSSRSINKITDLVDDLLNVSRMSQGEVPLQKDWFNVVGLVDGCCSHIRDAGTHSIVVTGDNSLNLYADEHRVDQVVVNLVNNAAKYAPVNSNIYLDVVQENRFVKISVRDNGPGIPTEKLPYLFDRYFRADESGSQISGLGLGLYISADIVRRHGGEIGVDSKVGEGSNFWFTLPWFI
ncbi:ATP-binding protein [Pedobacter sp. BMA]|uniref:PAS domain-containing sensor histidine kinase n=1 Tax=Pedobacter sp. BMA TaxID=1663685 RepID=UPI000649A7E7|nr:ATP-binding protein [Pedobacter sp. BMA]KLT65635.1 hypothetical protein AB669_11250 [Pedobacter sp. BMA]